MKKNNIRIVEVSTTGYEEENFILLTTLSDTQIQSVVNPLVTEEREANDIIYDNQALTKILCDTYPNDMVIMYTKDCLHYLEF